MKPDIEQLILNRRYCCTYYCKRDPYPFWGLLTNINKFPVNRCWDFKETIYYSHGIVMKHITGYDGDTIHYFHYKSLKSIQTLIDLTYNQLMLPDEIIHYIALFV